MTAVHEEPTVAALLGRFRRHKQHSPTDWHVPCPAHDDNVEDSSKFSLHVTVRGGHILLYCFAGCSVSDVLDAVGLPMSALFLNGPNGHGHAPVHRERPPTLAEFARLKQITSSLLVSEEWTETADGIDIPYRQRDGSVWRVQHRRSLQPGAGFTWDGQTDKPLIPYGRHRLDPVMEKGELWLVEGASDALTAWQHGLACLGLPGNRTTAALSGEDLAGIETLWIVREPGKSGDGFIAGLQKRLRQLEWTGAAHVVTLPAKDLSDLHVLAPTEFWPAIKAGQAAAVDLFSEPPSTVYPAILGVDAELFIARTYPQPAPVVEGILPSDGPGFIAGEEKLCKTMYALEEGLCIALGLPVCGRFAVPSRRRVLFIEEEDSPRRTHMRLHALLRGHGLDPQDAAVGRDLKAWLQISVWEGFTFDSPDMVSRLEATISAHGPQVVYFDALRKLTTKDLNKADQIRPVLDGLDDLRRRFDCLFRIVHHYRKSSGGGFRTGRGSQELGGSFALGAWAENSIFFEPVGRKQGAVNVGIQTKDGAPVPGFRLTIKSDGPWHAPTLLRLVAATEEAAGDQSGTDDAVLQAVATLGKTAAVTGRPGVAIATIKAGLQKADKTIRRSLTSLKETNRVRISGHASKQQVLYEVTE